MKELLLVMMGGAGGSALRYLAGLLAFEAFGPSMPIGTLGVNVIGSFLMGLLVATAERGAIAEETRLFLGVGLLGGFTTFSAFSADTIRLLTDGQSVLAGAYVIASVALSLAAFLAGYALVRLGSGP